MKLLLYSWKKVFRRKGLLNFKDSDGTTSRYTGSQASGLLPVSFSLGHTQSMQIPEELKTRSIDLAPLGLNELGWTKTDALELLTHLQHGFCIVLGGDVLSRTQDGWQHNYDNWHFNPDSSQSQERNSTLSINLAIDYIQKYQVGNFAFVLVLA